MIRSVELCKEILQYLGISDYSISRVEFFLKINSTKINKSKNVRIRLALNSVLTFNHYRYICASAPINLQSLSTQISCYSMHVSPQNRDPTI